MELMKRAVTPIFAVVLVVGILAGVHGLVDAVHNQTATAPRTNTEFPSLTFDAGASLSADTRSVFAPATAPQPAERFASMMGAESDPQTRNRFGGDVGRQFAGQVAAAGDSRPAPLALPAPANAVPLPPPNSDWPIAIDPPARNRPSEAPPPHDPEPHASAGRRIIDKELPNSSAEERDLWNETMKDLPLNDLRELLRLRGQVGRLSPQFGESGPSAGQPSFLPPGLPARDAGPLVMPPNGGALSAEPDPGRVLSQTLAALERARHVVLNNIANAQTNGYKRRLISFESAADRPLHSSRTEGSLHFAPGAPVDAGARLAPVIVDMEPGRLVRTNRSLDLAIVGPGFFHVVDPQKKRDAYTRRGRFTTNAAGQLVLAADGVDWILEPSVTFSDEAPGRIQTARFVAPGNMVGIDGTFFVPGAGIKPDMNSAGAAGHGVLLPGFLEESNVEVQHELEQLARLAGQIQALHQAARMLRAGDIEPPTGPSEEVP